MLAHSTRDDYIVEGERAGYPNGNGKGNDLGINVGKGNEATANSTRAALPAIRAFAQNRSDASRKTQDRGYLSLTRALPTRLWEDAEQRRENSGKWNGSGTGEGGANCEETEEMCTSRGLAVWPEDAPLTLRTG